MEKVRAAVWGGGHADVVELFLEAGADVDLDAATLPLWDAASDGHADVVELLLKARADAGVTMDNGSTFAEVAAIHGHGDVLKLLIANGAPSPHHS